MEAAHNVLDESIEADRATLDELRARPDTLVLDQTELMRRELTELRPPADATILGETPRWVWYPWRRTLVRIPGPEGFRLLRSDRNRNKITRTEQEILRSKRVGIIGLSVGHAIAHTLVLEGLCGELRLADPDLIELSNLNRIPGSLLDLGLNKAETVARRIAELDPYVQVTVTEHAVDGDNLAEFLDGLDAVIEECDSLDVKLQVREAARQMRIPVLMETSDRGLLDIERFDVSPTMPIFHGLLDDLKADDLAGLSTHDKVPYVLRILEGNELSARMAASMAEIDETVTTWPQLGGDIMLGAASVAAAVRALFTGKPLDSGRIRIDLDRELVGLQPPVKDERPVVPPLPQVEVPPAHDLGVYIAHAASRAPSGGNTQPWRFESDEHEFRIYVDPSRTSRMDVALRGSYVAAGAALLNARVAASSTGRLGPVEVMPTPDDPTHAATLRYGDEVDLDLAELYPQVMRRTANRHLGQPHQIPAEQIDALDKVAGRESARIHVVDDPESINEIADLLGESDRYRFLDETLHREMMSELSWPGIDSPELGIDVRTLELDDSELAKLDVARRRDVMEQLDDWNAGRALGDVTRKKVRASSAVAVVTTTGNRPADYVSAGSAVERVWMSAEQMGLAVHPVSPVFIYATSWSDLLGLVSERRSAEVDALAGRFRQLTGVPESETLGLVLRLSLAPPPSYSSARLPLERVFASTDSVSAR